MKRVFTQTATRTITLTREIVVEFPAEMHPDSVDEVALGQLLSEAEVDWEVDDVEFDIDGTNWSDADDDETPHVVYEE